MSLRPSILTLLLLPPLACTLPTYDPQASATAATTGTTSTSITSTTAPTTTFDETSTSTDATSCSFIGCDTSLYPPGWCDIWPDDCPEGQKCMPYNNDGGNWWNSLKCSPVAPDPDKVGEPCTAENFGLSGIDSCERGSVCTNIDPDTGLGVCTATCKGPQRDPTCDAPDTFCAILGESVVYFCVPECDPILQDCLSGDATCVPVLTSSSHFFCFEDVSGEDGQAFDPCGFANECDPGLFCANPAIAVECDPMADGCCVPFCDLDEPATCPGQGQQCVPWYDDPADAASFNTDVGACALPQP